MVSEKETRAAVATTATTPSISNGSSSFTSSTATSDATRSTTSKSTTSSSSSSSSFGSPSPVRLRSLPPTASSTTSPYALSASQNYSAVRNNPYSQKRTRRSSNSHSSSSSSSSPGVMDVPRPAAGARHSQSSEASPTSPDDPRPLPLLPPTAAVATRPEHHFIATKRPAATAASLDSDSDEDFDVDSSMDSVMAAAAGTAARLLPHHRLPVQPRRNPYATAAHKKPTTTTTPTTTTHKRGGKGATIVPAGSSRPPPTRIWRPGERDAWEGTPSHRLPPSDRFFAALLRSTPVEYRQCGSGKGGTGGSGGGALWHTLCARLSLPIPDRPPAPRCVRPTDDNNDDIYDIYDTPTGTPGIEKDDRMDSRNTRTNTTKSTTHEKAAAMTPWPVVNVNHAIATVVPPSPSVDHHFAVRAALVVEEARFAISQGLCGGRGGGGNGGMKGSSSSMLLVVDRVEVSATLGHVRIVVRKPFQPFTRDELASLRPGTVVEISSRDARARSTTSTSSSSAASPAIHSALAFVVTTNRDQLESQRQFSVLAFVPLDIREGGEWKVSIVANCISESRCYEALVNPHLRQQSALLPSLLGWGNPPTTTNTTTQEKPTAASSTPSIRTFFQPKGAKDVDNATAAPAPSSALNATQELASASFLDAPPGTVAIVQGPPGTGKTTLLVTVIRRYLEQPPHPMLSAENQPPPPRHGGAPDGNGKYRDRRRGGYGGGDYSTPPTTTLASRPRRLLVCAPTNKAVSVLATRFVQSLESAPRSPTALASPINVVLVGDADKLLEGAGKSSPLRRVFLYTWMEAISDEYRKLRNAFMPGGNSRGTLSMHDLLHTARMLQARLLSNLEGLQAELLTATAQVTEALQGLTKKDAAAPASGALPTGWSGLGQHQIVPRIEKLLKLLANVPKDHVWRQVLNNAHVVFCTLVCAGGAVFKNTRPVDDCIVDEAAAATEPEVCIPLHLRPSRLLLVGDPLQLPATILSQTAATLGLGKSLQERLMIDCRYPHVMLDVQYRMKPDICQFPSQRFYESRLLNGGNVIQESYGRNSRRVLGGRPYTFVQVSGVEEQGAGGSYRNPAEAQVVLDLIQQLKPVDNSCKDWQSPNRIRVITYYQAQVGLLQRLFRQQSLSVVVATVDSSQGCEADIVLVSLVRTSPSVGFLADDRRLNVSLTRARHQLVCVGHARQLQTCSSETVRLLARDAHDRGCVAPYPSPHAPNGRGTAAADRRPPCRVARY